MEQGGFYDAERCEVRNKEPYFSEPSKTGGTDVS